MHHILWHFSVWEVAHRWHGYDPNLTSELTLPLDVQDTIRLICKLITRLDIDVCDSIGIQLKNPDRFPDWISYEKNELDRVNDLIHMQGMAFTFYEWMKYKKNKSPKLSDLARKATFTLNHLPIKHEDRIYDEYCESLDNWSRPRELLTDGIEVTFTERKYPKDLLERIHLSPDIIEDFCRLTGYELPRFLFNDEQRSEFLRAWKEQCPDEDGEQQGNDLVKTFNTQMTDIPKTQQAIDELWNKLQPSQSARLVCRYIASQLWENDSTITIEQMKKHDAIQVYGGAKFYAGKNTVRDWLKDLAPSRTPGRPKKKRI